MNPLPTEQQELIDRLAKPKQGKEIKFTVPTNTLDLADEKSTWRREITKRVTRTSEVTTEQTYDVVFVSGPDDPQAVMMMVKPVMDALGVTILQAREILDSLPQVLKSDVTFDEAKKLVKALSSANSMAVVELREASK